MSDRLWQIVGMVLVCCACSLEGFIVTLTPTPEDVILPTMTSTSEPTVTVSPTSTLESGIKCVPQENLSIECKATSCVVRNEPKQGNDFRAYSVPNGVVIPAESLCYCPFCAPLEEHWFYLGSDLWAIQMDLVWEEN